MPKTPIFNYRLKITSKLGEFSQPTSTFFVRRDGRTSYFSASETPLALSNLLSGRTAETRFALEDASDGGDAAKILRTVLEEIWAQNKPLCPVVTVLA